ncbi:MAG: VanW family protein [Candidatus Gottesmanbacteria bacterium]|nr:VanW family protein [Candidatus Gottesmanbacteria bacterium]
MGERKHKGIRDSIIALLLSAVILGLGTVVTIRVFDAVYAGRVYPNVTINGTNFGGKTPHEVKSFWTAKNIPFEKATFTFVFENNVATVSGTDLGLGYDATLSATQAYLVGRSGNLLTDLITKFSPNPTNLTPLFRFQEDVLSDTLNNLSLAINIPVTDALFEFRSGKVTAFRLSKDGREVDLAETKKRFSDAVSGIPTADITTIVISLPVNPVKPSMTTDRVNAFGIKELIGRGYSEFAHSIPGRVHNVALASAKLHGLLIKPGDTFSFNDALGDVSAATGFQPAYIIKDGRTVLGDGGGVCQVSTTLFRAALAAGLPIIDRRAHAYRVAYYEQAGYKAGLDATVFAPSVDLKIKNDTPGYILIQTKTDTKNMTLTFELYGTSDGRKAEIYNHVVSGITPPPPDLYQDDPTLPAGVVKQVDFAAWGAKTNFQYKVTRGSEVLQNTSFASNFRSWQAVFLRGTK